MSYLDKLKKNREKTFEKLQERLDKSDRKGDDSIWNVTKDKAGNGWATIRFLPQPENEKYEYVKLHNHSFKGPKGKWYIENCRSTIYDYDDDPVNVMASELFNSTEDRESDAWKKARKIKRKTLYVSNILVIDDPENPENNGKVFRFRYGSKIHAKITNAMKPKFPNDPKFNPFDLFEGANFTLKVFKDEQSGYPNYDSSSFESKIGPVTDKDGNEYDENQLVEMLDNLYSLEELIAEDQFKSYAELEKRLYSVLDMDNDNTSNKDGYDKSDDEKEDFKPKFKEDNSKSKELEEDLEDNIPDFDSDDDDDLDEDFFSDLED